jgi:hypothetical protein
MKTQSDSTYSIKANATLVKYASVLPSTGKTRWAIKELTKRVKNRTGITLYVAPTLQLLEEVQSAILLSLTGLQARRVYYVKSGEGEDQVARQIITLLKGGRNNYGMTVSPCEVGSVILCTHLGFLKLPHGFRKVIQSNGDITRVQRVARRDQVSVIFDEARKCNLKSNNFTMPYGVFQRLTEEFITIHNSVTDPEKYLRLTPRETLTGRRKTLNTKRFNAIFMDEDGKTTKDMERIRDKVRILMHTLYSSSIHMYVTTSVEEDPEDNSRLYISMHTVLVPYEIFSGWKDVILLSAFFEQSQMYHLLKSCDVSDQYPHETKRDWKRRITSAMNRDINSCVILEDVTDRVVEAGRIDQVKKRYAATTITYISPNTSFGQRHLKTGVLVSPEVYKKFGLSSFFKQYKELARRRKISIDKGTKTKSRLLPFRLAARIASHVNINDTEHEIVKHIKTLPDLYIKHTPLQYYCKAAVTMSRNWLKRQNINPQPVPITVNVGSKSKQSAFWKKEVVKVVKPGRDVIEMPVMSQGLNCFMSSDTIAFLATLNPSPEIVNLFRQLCPTYNPTFDHTLDQCIQSTTRCSIRDTESKTKPLIIVTDYAMAKLVQQQLAGLPKIIPPERLGVIPMDPIFYVTEEDPEERKARRKKPATKLKDKIYRESTAAWRAYLLKNSASTRNYSNMLSNITKLKKRDPDSPKLLAMVDRKKELSAQRKIDIARLKPLFNAGK